MAFFKFRLPGRAAGQQASNSGTATTESIEVLRRRARHRLIGASVLVVLGVVGFPLVFDTQPRPMSADIEIDIPDRAASKPWVSSTLASKPLDTWAALDPKEEVVSSDKAARMAPAKSEAKADTKVTSKPKNEQSKTDVPRTDARAADDKSAVSDSKDDAARFIVQVGSFSEDGKARELRAKLEKAGYKTYTHVATTKDGQFTRVRVGPFSSRDEADKVAQKIKQLQLQPAVLAL